MRHFVLTFPGERRNLPGETRITWITNIRAPHEFAVGGTPMAKTVDHIVTRPGRKHGDPDVQIPVAEDLSTVPGIRQREADVSFYSRVHPQETQNIEKAADRQWVWTVYSEETLAHRKRHDELN